MYYELCFGEISVSYVWLYSIFKDFEMLWLLVLMHTTQEINFLLHCHVWQKLKNEKSHTVHLDYFSRHQAAFFVPEHFHHRAYSHVTPVSLRNDGCTRCSKFVCFRKVEQRVPVDFLPQSRAHFAGKSKIIPKEGEKKAGTRSG